ncbi:hypothetical protein pb186bvf_014293 [Paramecium bursaria]
MRVNILFDISFQYAKVIDIHLDNYDIINKQMKFSQNSIQRNFSHLEQINQSIQKSFLCLITYIEDQEICEVIIVILDDIKNIYSKYQLNTDNAVFTNDSNFVTYRVSQDKGLDYDICLQDIEKQVQIMNIVSLVTQNQLKKDIQIKSQGMNNNLAKHLQSYQRKYIQVYIHKLNYLKIQLWIEKYDSI